jgi:glycosyltransferase involved in cell wall biosynthesis
MSICIAVGPHENFSSLRSTLESILNQSIESVEVVIKVYKNILINEINEFIKYKKCDFNIISGDDLGIYDAFNICIKESRGDYLLFLGCGDTLSSNSICLEISDFIKEKKYPELIYGEVKLIKFNGDILLYSNKCFEGIKNLTPWRNPCHSQGIIYKKSWIMDKLFPIDQGPLADLIHTYRFNVHKKAIWINTVVSIFIEGGASNDNGYKTFIKCRKGVIANCDNFQYPIAWKTVSYFAYTAHYIYRRFLKLS